MSKCPQMERVIRALAEQHGFDLDRDAGVLVLSKDEPGALPLVIARRDSKDMDMRFAFDLEVCQYALMSRAPVWRRDADEFGAVKGVFFRTESPGWWLAGIVPGTGAGIQRRGPENALELVAFTEAWAAVIEAEWSGPEVHRLATLPPVGRRIQPVALEPATAEEEELVRSLAESSARTQAALDRAGATRERLVLAALRERLPTAEADLRALGYGFTLAEVERFSDDATEGSDQLTDAEGSLLRAVDNALFFGTSAAFRMTQSDDQPPDS
jgi:hypothetical protein